MSKFLEGVEDHTPKKDIDAVTVAKRHVQKILLKAGYNAEAKAFEDDITLHLEDGTIVVLEVKSATKPDVDAEEDFETPAQTKKRLSKMENDKSMLGQAAKALAAGKEVKAAANPNRPSRGVKQIDKSIDKLAGGVSKAIDRVTKSLK